VRGCGLVRFGLVRCGVCERLQVGGSRGALLEWYESASDARQGAPPQQPPPNGGRPALPPLPGPRPAPPCALPGRTWRKSNPRLRATRLANSSAKTPQSQLFRCSLTFGVSTRQWAVSHFWGVQGRPGCIHARARWRVGLGDGAGVGLTKKSPLRGSKRRGWASAGREGLLLDEGSPRFGGSGTDVDQEASGPPACDLRWSYSCKNTP
jgi:hypothetical protein